jgi:hypothetical protein
MTRRKKRKKRRKIWLAALAASVGRRQSININCATVDSLKSKLIGEECEATANSRLVAQYWLKESEG